MTSDPTSSILMSSSTAACEPGESLIKHRFLDETEIGVAAGRKVLAL